MKQKKRNLDQNIDVKVVSGFGDEWDRFDQTYLKEIERSKIYSDYFSSFPWGKLSKNAIGIDIGCGSGRWAQVTCKHVPSLVLMDASSKALGVARKNLKGVDNVAFLEASVGAIPLANNSLDFAYSLGVLHHVPDTKAAIGEVARVLKSGAPFLVYLYYALDGQGWWYKLLWRVTDLGRSVVCRLPRFLKNLVCDTIAAFVYWPLARTAKLLKNKGFIVERFPLSYYLDKSFYSMRTDALDRFGTKLEQRFSRAEIQVMLEENGFRNVTFNAEKPYWCALAFKA